MFRAIYLHIQSLLNIPEHTRLPCSSDLTSFGTNTGAMAPVANIRGTPRPREACLLMKLEHHHAYVQYLLAVWCTHENPLMPKKRHREQCYFQLVGSLSFEVF